jgi:hypothetical protein
LMSRDEEEVVEEVRMELTACQPDGCWLHRVIRTISNTAQPKVACPYRSNRG